MDKDVMDLSFTNEHPPVNGCLLLSEPFLEDSYFQRSIVLICNNDEKGAFGFVLNKYLPLRIGDLNDAFADHKGKIALGGPVDNESLYFIHQLSEHISGGLHIAEDLYYGGHFDELSNYIRLNPEALGKVRFFIGYSGWASNQLEEELSENTWKVVPTYSISEMMSNFDDDVWKVVMKKQGKKYSILSNSPIDPSNN